MPLLKNVESKIQSIERFRVAFTKNGVDVKGNKADIPQYSYLVAAQGNWTVSEWINKRFRQLYPGYDVRVFTKNGTIATGNMTLATVRGEK